MNIVFLTGASYPNFDAVGFCAYQVQKCLSSDFRISVVSYHSEPNGPDDDMVDSIRLYRFETEDMKQRAAALRSESRLAPMRHQILRIRGALRRLLSPTTVNQALVTAYRDTLDRLDSKPDVLIPLVFPIETVVAALAYKADHPDAMLMPYLFDDFVDSGSLHVLKIAREIKRHRHLGLERRMLSEANAVLAMHPLRLHLERNFDTNLLRKVVFLEHPLLFPPAAPPQRTDDGILRLCFTGSLIRKVREPRYLIDLLRALTSERRVRADFFVMGNAAHDVPSGMLTNGVEIVNHGRVPKAQADAAVARADILINLGEVTGRQISSKVFEYMATGKPILHLASVGTDAVTTILSKYPLALCLKNEKARLAENARRVSDLIASETLGSLSFEQVKATYPEALPSATADAIRRLLQSPSRDEPR